MDNEFDLKQANLEVSVECPGREVKYLATQSCEPQTGNGSITSGACQSRRPSGPTPNLLIPNLYLTIPSTL